MSESFAFNWSLFKLITIRYIFNGAWIVFLVSLIIFHLTKRIKRWLRTVHLMSKVPGPPSHFLLGHANLVLQMDKANYPYGTYVRK